MNRLTAKQARVLVELSKIENIYTSIADRAKTGHLHLEVPYISEKLFKLLIEDGFIIYADNGETRVIRYDQEYMFRTKDFEIVWEG